MEPLLKDMLPSWELALRAQRKSPNTVENYTYGVTRFLRWCAETGHSPELTKPLVQEFMVDLLDGGAEPATVTARRTALCRFSAWLAEEGELEDNPLLGLKRPKVDSKVVTALDDDELSRLVKSCRGSSLVDRRDEALIRLMLETGLRASEVIGLEVGDINLLKGLMLVHGKGRKDRVAPFGPQAAAALDRYMRLRRRHPLADTKKLWLGAGGKSYGYQALRKTMRVRGELVGIYGLHPHKLRHTAATRWLRNGGSETGLMAVAGWSTRNMIDRYTGSSASERAAAEARHLNLGELES